MGDGKVYLLAGALDDTVLEPARLFRRQGGDDDLIGGEESQRILDRQVGVGIADFPTNPQPQLP